MTRYGGPLGRALAREPVTPRQLARLADYMRDAGVATTDPEWPATVARVLGVHAATDPAQWSKGQASAFLDTLEDFLGRPVATPTEFEGITPDLAFVAPRRCPSCRGKGVTGPPWDPDPCGSCRGTGAVHG